jgi:hypothetical protein
MRRERQRQRVAIRATRQGIRGRPGGGAAGRGVSAVERGGRVAGLISSIGEPVVLVYTTVGS